MLLALLSFWNFTAPLPATLEAAVRGIAPVHALAWACMGAGLLVRQHRSAIAWQRAFGVGVLLLAGVLWLNAAAVPLPERAVGAPMPLVSIGLICAALPLFIAPTRQPGLATIALLRWLPASLLTVLALLGIMSVALNDHREELWLASFDIPPGTAVAFLVLTLSMIREPPDAHVAQLREDFRISIMSLTVLSAVVVVTGISTFWAVQGRLQESERERLVQSAYRREMAFNFQLATAGSLGSELARSPNVRRALAMWPTEPQVAGPMLAEELAAAWHEDVTAIRFEPPSPLPAQLPARGEILPSTLPGVVIDHASDSHFELQWNDGLMAYARVPVQDEGRTLGWVVLQQRLPLMTEQLFETTDLGPHVRVRLCTPASATQAWCLPSRHGGSSARLPLHDARGAPSAIALAIRGEQGTVITNDESGTAVIDVYASVQRPLGLTLRQSLDTVVAPVREKLKQVFSVIGAMLALGMVTLNLQVRPLARRLVLNERRLSTVMSHVSDGIVTTDADGRVTFINDAAQALTGWASAEAIGRPLGDVYRLIDPATEQPATDILARALAGQSESVEHDLDLVSRNGQRRLPVSYTVSPVKDRSETVVGTVLVFRDATEARHREATISYEASHDAFTGLINRKEFERRLALLARSDRAGDAGPHALLYIDLDKFKQVNDSAGHAAGDELLRQVSRCMQLELRASDMLARVGGDEFTALLPNCALPDASRIANQVKDAVAAFTFEREGTSFKVGTSIGAVGFRPGGLDPAGIVSAADAACYRAKAAGRNNVQVHEAVLAATADQK